ncbi:DUF86 domain-containing protein [Candidatus Uhrbacteria bacterium]|nr:DUF86 domain-containing protein [Candidatus Uhrbacteria bacterium]
MQKRSIELYLQDILECVDLIEEYTSHTSREEFFENQQLVDAVVRRLGILGEAARQTPDGFRTEHPEVPWNRMIGMRNKILHEYFGVDEAILWQTIREDIPPLRAIIATLLQRQDRDGDGARAA